MKILYIASNPEGQADLRLEKEITELQYQTMQMSSQGLEFIFLPDLPYERIDSMIFQLRPDIVHISAHGKPEELILANSSEGPVPLTADSLKAIFSGVYRPRLVFLSACNSNHLAENLSTVVPMVIGTTDPITNRAAREGAITFYSGLLQGQSVQEAYECAKCKIESLSMNKVSIELESKRIIRPDNQYFFIPARLVARFEDDNFKPDKEGFFKIKLGLIGCYPSTTQVIFFTDDETFLTSKFSADDLCIVIRSTPVHSEVWMEDPWLIYGDCNFYACATTADGKHLSVASTLNEMLENFYSLSRQKGKSSKLDDDLVQALNELSKNDGAHYKNFSNEKREAIDKKRKERNVKSKPHKIQVTAGNLGINGKGSKSEVKIGKDN